MDANILETVQTKMEKKKKDRFGMCGQGLVLKFPEGIASFQLL